VLLSSASPNAPQGMEVDRPDNQALLASSGWMLEFEEDVLVNRGGVAAGPSTAGSTNPSRTKIAVHTDGSIDNWLVVRYSDPASMDRGAKHSLSSLIRFVVLLSVIFLVVLMNRYCASISVPATCKEFMYLESACRISKSIHWVHRPSQLQK